MPAFYLETSALLKRYKSETGTPVIQAMFSGRTQADRFIVCQLLVGEVEAAASRFLGPEIIGAEARLEFFQKFTRDYAGMEVVPVTGELLEEADVLARSYRLRWLDAIHLAAAMQVVEAVGWHLILVTSDSELVAAGRSAGLAVLDPAEPGALEALGRLRS